MERKNMRKKEESEEGENRKVDKDGEEKKEMMGKKRRENICKRTTDREEKERGKEHMSKEGTKNETQSR